MKVIQWGEDLAVVLPQELIDGLMLREGDEIDIVAANRNGAAADSKDAGGGPSKDPPC